MMHSLRSAQIEDVGRLKTPMRLIHFWRSLSGGGNRHFSVSDAKPARVGLSFVVPSKQVACMAPKSAIEMAPSDAFYGTICLLLTRYP